MGALDRMKTAAGDGALARMRQTAVKQSSLATERADEADKLLVPSKSRQEAQEGRYRPVAIPMPRQVETKPATPVSTPKAVQRSGNYNLQSLPDLGRGPSRAATTEKPIKSGWADERVWDRQISTAIGTLEKPKISTLPFTGEPPALMLLSATAATNQQEGRSRPTAVSTSKQRNKQSSLATERADEADKMMVPSESRQHQQALATERADEADKLLVPSASRQAAQSTTTSSARSQEGRSRPVEIDMPKQVVTREEWAAQQWNALTQKINDAQTKLDAANARYADVARYGTVEDRISLRTEIRDLEQQIKDLKKERGDPNLLERLSKTLSGTVEQYFGSLTNTAGVAAEAQKGTAMSGVYQAQVESLDQQIAALEKTLNDPTMTEQEIADTNEALRIAREQRALYGSAVRAGEGTAREVYNIADELSASGAKDIERAKQGADTLGKIGIDVLSQGVQMGTDAAFGAITGGGAQEARQNGADLGQAVNYGAASAAVEVLTEKIVDFAGVYGGKGTADEMIKNAISKLTTDETLRGALEIAASAAGESVEEFVSGIVNPALKSLYNGKSIGENRSELEWKDVLYDMLIGGILGGVGGAVDVARGGSETQKTVSAEVMAKAAQAVEELGAKPSVAQTEVEANRLPGYGEQDVARREQFRTAEQTARKFGAELEVAELPSGVDGEYRDGKIVISPSAKNPVMTVAVHELTHHMESSSRYGEFSRMILDYVSDEMGVDIDTMKNAIRSEYAKGGFELDDIGAERELVAKFAESKLFQDEAAINRLARTNRSMLQTVKDWISDMVVKLTGTEEEKFFRNAERLYEKALREVGDTTNTNGGQAQYRIVETPDGKKYVRADRLVISGMDPDSWSEQLEDYINGKIRKGQNVPLITANGDVLLLTGTSAGKMADNHRSNGTSLTNTQFERKVNAASHIDELVEIAEKINDKPRADKNSRHGGMASGGWDYYEAFFMDFDGRYYLVTISAAIGENGTVVYNVGQMQERDPSAINGSSANGGAQNEKASFEERDPSAISGSSANGGAKNEKASFDERLPSVIDGSSANGGALRGKASFGDRITFDASNVKEGLSGESSGADSTSYADTLREMQPPGARKSTSYTDELAHVNELLQNAVLSPRDQAYIQEDIADAQRSCDAAMKMIVNPGTTAEERAQAVQRAIDAVDYARQRIDDLGLPATQLGVGTAQDALADISEKLRRYLLE